MCSSRVGLAPLGVERHQLRRAQAAGDRSDSGRIWLPSSHLPTLPPPESRFEQRWPGSCVSTVGSLGGRHQTARGQTSSLRLLAQSACQSKRRQTQSPGQRSIRGPSAEGPTSANTAITKHHRLDCSPRTGILQPCCNSSLLPPFCLT